MDYTKADEFIGDKLYCARVVRRLTQKDMAELISIKMKESGKQRGISRQAYAFYEKGERSMPMEVFTIACEILSLNRNQIFNEALDSIKR